MPVTETAGCPPCGDTRACYFCRAEATRRRLAALEVALSRLLLELDAECVLSWRAKAAVAKAREAVTQ